MRINEIVEPRATKEKIPAGKYPLGAGAIAKVYPHETDPHMVVKKEKSHFKNSWGEVPHPHSRKDAFAYFVDAAAPHIQSNPYLPRVYVKNTRTDKKAGVISYTYVIEKLNDVSNTNLNTELIDAIAEKVLARPHIITRDKTLYNKWSNLTNAISNAIEKRDYSNIIDPQLVEVSEIINQAMEKFWTDWPNSNIKIDLHAGNFMIRMTPVGPQLVVTDPLYSW